MLCIDPMHNLFLGTGKRMLSIWIENELLSRKDFCGIQQFVDDIIVPADIGRIPLKIESSFAGFKADQFKTWITIFSIPALFNVLPTEHLECWRHFVLACRILCKQSLSSCDINLADALLMQFCRRVERLYGNSVVTPNMHLHGHLKDAFLDYGPAQEIWLFSFERYNGKMPTNNRSIESQLMQRFLRDNYANSFAFPEEFKENFSSLLTISDEVVGSVCDTLVTSNFVLSLKYFRAVFDSDCVAVLRQLYYKVFPDNHITSLSGNSIFVKYMSLTLKGRLLSCCGRRRHPFIVQALWNEDLYGTPPTTLPEPHQPNSHFRPVYVHYFVKAFFVVDDVQSSLILVYVSWLFPHPQRYALGKPCEIWCNAMYESFGVHSFVPLNNVVCRCAHGVMEYNGENVRLVVPLVE